MRPGREVWERMPERRYRFTVSRSTLKGRSPASALAAAVQAVRAAYRAGNASSYSTALEEAEAAINAALEMVRS